MKNFSFLLQRSIALISLLAIFGAAVFAQQSRSSLRGLVTDELGAAVVGANVVLNDAAGVQKAATTTNGEGVYVFNGVQPGKYVLLASAPGFAGSDPTEVQLAAGQRISQDLTLR